MSAMQLTNIINQTDGLINLKIARAARLTAVSSRRDSSSMKMLAFVTTCFLPGSFIAALFSTDMFVWNDAGSLMAKATPMFRVYCAITVPLTLTTLLAYGVWVIARQMQQERVEKRTDDELLSQIPGVTAEADLLAARRKSMWRNEESV